MKKFFLFLVFLASLSINGNAQYFQGGFSLGTNDTIIFKIKAVGPDFTTGIGYLQNSFRYKTSAAPSLTVSAPVNGALLGPSSSPCPITPLPDYVDGDYTYKNFVLNTAQIASQLYVSGTEYEVFKIKISTPAPSAALGIELAARFDFDDTKFAFGVSDGAGVLIDPGAGDLLYGPGIFSDDIGQYVPLFNSTVSVNYINLTVNRQKTDAILNWNARFEDNRVKLYELQRSFNGVNFEKLSNVTPKMNGLTSNSYQFVDKNLTANMNSKAVYYRVKQVLADNKFIYSPIRSISVSDESTLTLAPNPAQNFTTLNYSLNKLQPVTFSIIDGSGKVVSQNQQQGVKGINQFRINVSKLAKGNYILSIKTAESINNVPFIKL